MRDTHPYQKAALAVTKAVGSPASIVVHTIFFAVCFIVVLVHIVEFNTMLLVLTTLVSLEAIYLAIFIQMTINITTESIEEVGEDIGEIQKDVDEIQKDVDEIQTDIDEVQEDVGEIQTDVDELQEDVEEIAEDDAIDDNASQEEVLRSIRTDIQKLLADLDRMQKVGQSFPSPLSISPRLKATKKPRKSKSKKK